MWVALVCLLTADPPGVERARDAAKRGRAAAVELEWKSAITAYDEALSAYRDAHHMVKRPEEIANVLFDLGAAWLSLERTDRADAAFTRGLGFAPALQPDPKVYPPAVVERVQRIARELRKRAPGSLSVVARPEGAVVWLDAQRLGEAPLSAPDLAPGEHWLTLTADDHAPFTTTITIGAGKVERAEVFLRSLAEAPKSQPVVVAPPPPASQPRVVQIPPPPLPEKKRTHVVAAILPFGIGQFVEGRPLAGALFLSTEALLLATNLVCLGVMLADRTPDGRFNDAARSNTIRWVGNAALLALVAEMVGGAIDGGLNR